MDLSIGGIKALQMNMEVNGNPFVVHPTLLWDDKDVILVDTGLPGQLKLIRDLFERESIPFERLTKIIITHQDFDHIGGLAEIINTTTSSIQVLAHEFAIPYLAGEVPLIKSKRLASPVKVDITLQDGDILPYAGGIQVLFTPGHTPDHISLYHIPSKTLIAGDALTSQEGVLKSFDPKFTIDHLAALQSIAKFQEFNMETVITYHGGVCKENIKERLQEILDTTPTD